MKRSLISIALLCVLSLSHLALAETVGFDRDAVGDVPEGWMCDVTGRGSPRWAVESDASAPSRPNVLKQSGKGTFPWCAKKGATLSDGFVEVKFKPLQGEEDQAGGVMWRFKDGNNYYVARANAKENNISLYYTRRGTRSTLKYVDAPVALNEWHVLRVDFGGKRIRVSLDGKQYIDLENDRVGGPGLVGVWTKADSMTLFDDFTWSTQ
jgi:hypothetical protein